MNVAPAERRGAPHRSALLAPKRDNRLPRIRETSVSETFDVTPACPNCGITGLRIDKDLPGNPISCPQCGVLGPEDEVVPRLQQATVDAVGSAMSDVVSDFNKRFAGR